jgi:uncharacterized protein (DUF488 family)
MPQFSETCSHSAPPRLLTIGYQGATPAAFVEALRRADVALLADVRAVAWSRRPGFGKTALRRTLEGAGIDYRHLPALGNPKPGRDAARAGQIAAYRAIYAAQLATPDARAALDALAGLAALTRVCLMCFERDPDDCHRALVAQALQARLAGGVVHLMVPP